MSGGRAPDHGPELQHAVGTPCDHPGCLSHATHPCEGCGRIGGRPRALVLCLCGVSGAGKSFLRQTKQEFRDLPVVDISDVYRELPWADYVEATLEVARRTRELLKSHDAVLIEGFFIAGSPSRLLLEDELSRLDAEVKFTLVHAPMETCETRLRLQRTRGEITESDFQVRLGMLKRCWHRAEEAARRIR